MGINFLRAFVSPGVMVAVSSESSPRSPAHLTIQYHWIDPDWFCRESRQDLKCLWGACMCHTGFGFR